jgi:hypothetical protein
MSPSSLTLAVALALAAGCSCAAEHVRDEDASVPRTDAAAPLLGACSELTDAQLMAAVYGGPLVPTGFYDETFGPMEGAQWRAPCSPSLDETRTRATALFGATSVTGTERSTTQFHEVDVRSGGFAYHYRNTRCDYFDGTTLDGGRFVNDPGPVKALADYLWFVENHDLGGAHVLAGIERLGDATQRYDLCFVTTVYGDFGLCDEITLHTRAFASGPDGRIAIDPDVDERTIRGTCN